MSGLIPVPRRRIYSAVTAHLDSGVTVSCQLSGLMNLKQQRIHL